MQEQKPLKKTQSPIAIFFFILIILIVVMFFIVLFGEQKTKIVKRSDPCISLDEPSCLAQSSCQPIYGPKSTNDNTQVFTACRKVTSQQKETYSKSRTLCENTGGIWLTTKYGEYCNCSSTLEQTVFDKDKGCV